MQSNTIKKQLLSDFPSEIVTILIDTFVKSIGEYRKGHWKYVTDELGQFIECSRMMIEHKLGNRGVCLSMTLDIFDEKQLQKWEKSNGQVEYRIIIPRTLFSMTCIRNKRGAIHVSEVNPNKMDATLLLNGAKWILAEFFRLSSKLSFDETNSVIESITNKEIPLIWHINDVARVMDPNMSAREQVLVLLYDEDKQTDKELLISTGYGNGTRFRELLKHLHRERLIEYDHSVCSLSTLGMLQAERIISSNDINSTLFGKT